MAGFPARLRMSMAHAGISYRQLGEHLGVSAMTVSKWASGKCYPRSSYLTAICKKCNVTLDWLMEPGDPFTGQDTINALRAELNKLYAETKGFPHD